MNSDNDTDRDDDFISKSQRKRDMHDLQALGKQLTELTAGQLKKLDLPESLLDAILTAQAINSNSAKKRQSQYIGKLMRSVDADAVRQKLDELKSLSSVAKKHFHKLEQWRNKLLADGDAALPELLKDYPDTDRQHLRQLIRSAQKEKAQEKTPRAARVLFQYLRELMEQP